MRQKDGDTLSTQGSGDTVRRLLAAGLVDELRLVTCPVLLGRAKRLCEAQGNYLSGGAIGDHDGVGRIVDRACDRTCMRQVGVVAHVFRRSSVK